MSIIESHKNIIIDIIRNNIQNSQRVCIPDVVSFVNAIPLLKQELLTQYNNEICKGDSFTKYNIDENIAIMQAVINDTVIIGEDHNLYSNCLNDLLGVSEKHQVQAHLILAANMEGKCRSYRITKTRTRVMENDTGLVRTRESFDKKQFWIYSVFRSYVEFLLLWSEQSGILLEGYEGTKTGITFNATIKKRFNMPLKEWDLLHNKLDSFADIFNAQRILKDKHAGIVKVYTTNKKFEILSFLKTKYVYPLSLSNIIQLYGTKANKYQLMLIHRAGQFFKDLQPKMETISIDISEEELDHFTEIEQTTWFAEDFNMLSKTSSAFKTFIKPVEKLIMKEKVPVEEYSKLPDILNNNIVYIEDKQGYAGLYTTKNSVLTSFYGKKYTEKENDRITVLKHYLNNDSLLKKYAANIEMGENGLAMLMSNINQELTHPIPNIFNGNTIKAYDLLDCYKGSKLATPLFVEYFDLDNISEVIICD